MISSYMKIVIGVLLMLFISEIGTGQVIGSSEFSIGETVKIRSEVLDENRVINVYLPESYHRDSLKKYPVIYLLDGSKDEDFIHIAGLVQFCSFSWINIVPESIVVGIANVDRKRDFTYPSTMEIDRKDFPTSGKSANFINFIADELQGIIEDRYRVEDEKTLIGQSLGGLLATEILMKRSDLFDNYIIVSPSLWWDGEKLLTYELPNGLSEKNIYIGVGKEGTVMEKGAKSLYEKLNPTAKEGKIHFSFFEAQDHGDALHLAVYDAFEKMFGKREVE